MKVYLCLITIILALLVGCQRPRSNQTAKPKIEKITASANYQDNILPIKKIVAKEVGIDIEKLKETIPLMSKEIGADELDIIEIILAIEETYDISIPDEALGKTNEDIIEKLTIAELARVVAQQAKR